MPPARPASGAAALREVAAESLDVEFDFPLNREIRGRGPRSLDPADQRLGAVIPIQQARSWAQPKRSDSRRAQPAVLARWAVVIAVVCMLAALTSGQA